MATACCYVRARVLRLLQALGGSWVTINRVTSPRILLVITVTLLITTLITTHEPPSSTQAVSPNYKPPSSVPNPGLDSAWRLRELESQVNPSFDIISFVPFLLEKIKNKY